MSFSIVRKYLPEGVLTALTHVCGYAAWIVAYRLIVLTLVTYLLMSSNARFQEISDFYGSNELVIVGFGALLYILILRFLNPLTSTTTEELFNPYRFEKRFIPGFLHGAVLASGVTLAFLLSGLYRYLGFFIQFEEAPLVLASVCLRIAALGALAYCEEYLFRQKIMNRFRRHMPDLYAAGLAAVAFCALKALQFDLGVSHLLTLFLLSYALAIRALVDEDFVRGAGFWTGLLIVFHPLLGLPVMGNDFQGVLLVKYQGSSEAHDGTARLLTGGLGGPLSSVALQLLLAFDIIQGILRNKKILLNSQAARLR